MKTAISLPDDMAQAIEAYIQTAQISRSEFYQRAAAAYLNLESKQSITDNLNAVYAQEEDPFNDAEFHRAALAHFRTLQEKETW